MSEFCLDLVLLLSSSGADKSRPPQPQFPQPVQACAPTLRAEGGAGDTPHSGCRGSVSHTPRCGLCRTHLVPVPSGCPLPLTLSFFPQDSDMLACHNYWHWALYLIEKVSWLAPPVSASRGRAASSPAALRGPGSAALSAPLSGVLRAVLFSDSFSGSDRSRPLSPSGLGNHGGCVRSVGTLQAGCLCCRGAPLSPSRDCACGGHQTPRVLCHRGARGGEHPGPGVLPLRVLLAVLFVIEKL